MAGEAGKEDEHEHPMCGVSIGKASNGQEKWGLVIGKSNMLSRSVLGRYDRVEYK